MPRNLDMTFTEVFTQVTRETLVQLLRPVDRFAKCENPSHTRRAILHALDKDLGKISPYVDLVPSTQTISLVSGHGRSARDLRAISTPEDANRAGLRAAAVLTNAMIMFEQAQEVAETARPILVYYGASSLLDFFCSCLVQRQGADHAHGLTLTCDSDGRDYEDGWLRTKCRVKVKRVGDFPHYVDALTLAGLPSLFSAFRLHKDAKPDPFVLMPNPRPLGAGSLSLDLICNFDAQRYELDNPQITGWLKYADRDKVMAVTNLLLDFLLVYAASVLARYHIPAWRKIIEGERGAALNDFAAAYRAMSVDAAHFFARQWPFMYSFL